MKLDFEYGQGLMSANLPDNTDIFVPGETVPDPECLPQDWDTLYGETLKSIRNPIGMKPLRRETFIALLVISFTTAEIILLFGLAVWWRRKSRGS